MDYNLLTEDWIPVVGKDGIFCRVSVIEAFKNAFNIRDFAPPNPMDRIALIRFFTALVYWGLGNPPEDRASLPDDHFPQDMFDKLEQNKDCFNLLGEEKRFYQVWREGVDPERKKPTTELLQEIPTGNNFWHFDHITSDDDSIGLCDICTIMGMLRLPLYTVSGLPDLKSGINGTPPIYIISLGRCLHDTLMLNWLRVDMEIGLPVWDNFPVCDSSELPPLLYALTVPARKVWLSEPEESNCRCVACGERRSVLFKNCQFTTAGTLENLQWNDPHVIYSTNSTGDRKTQKAPDLVKAGAFKMDRPWPYLTREISSLSPIEGSKLLIVGFATDKAKNIDAWEREIPLDELPEVPADLPDLIDQWQKSSAKVAKSFRRHAGLGQGLVNSFRPQIEDRVSDRLGQIISGEPTAWNEASSEYGVCMDAVAGSLYPRNTVADTEQRKRISAIRPEVNIPAEEDGNDCD